MTGKDDRPATKPWGLRCAAHLGIRSAQDPQFKHCVGSTDPLEQIRFIADLGFAGVFDNNLKLRPQKQQERIGSEIARLGLKMGSFVSNIDLGNKTPWYSRDADSRARIRQEVVESVAAAKRVDGRVINIVSGVDDTLDRDLQLSAMADNLKEVSPLADKAGVVLAIEPVSVRRVPDLLLRPLHEARSVVDAVGSVAVRIVFDTHHVSAMDGDVLANFERYRSSIGALQLADFPQRREPGAGKINFAKFFARLKALDYAGLIELEYDGAEPCERAERQALVALRAIDADSSNQE